MRTTNSVSSARGISDRDLKRACALFAQNEPRDLFYRAATELVALALIGKSGLSVAEALAVLLRTWNREFYRFHRFDNTHLEDLERVYEKHKRILRACRNRTIDTLGGTEDAPTNLERLPRQRLGHCTEKFVCKPSR
jgi:hypothetical protein